MLDAIPVQEQIFKGPFDKVTFHKGIKEMFQAFEAVHEAGLIHGALNTSSFMWLENPIKGSRYILVDLLHDRLAPLIQGESSSLAWMAEPTLTPVELYSEEAPTVQSDLFMLGQLIYTCLIGGHPFGGMSREQAKDAHLNTPIKPLHKYSLNISEAFSDWVATLYRKNPQDRPNSVREALDAMPPFIGKDGHKALIENHTSQNSTATEQLVQVGEPPKAHLPEKITNQLPITTTIEPTSPSHVTANLSSNRPTNKSGKFSPDSKHITILLICAAVILAIIASLLLISN